MMVNVPHNATSRRHREEYYFRLYRLGLIGLLLITTVSSCNRSGLVQVAGTVTFQGTPVDSGRIVFVSIDENSAPTSSGTIMKGAYEITGRGGVQPGKYRAQITVYPPGEPRKGLAMDQVPILEPIGPPAYAGDESPLTADVSRDEDVYDFDVP